MKMKRRDLFKALGATVCGIVIGVLGLSKTEKQDVAVVDKTESVQKREQMIMDFAPDEIVSSEIFHGRFLVCCKHSIWEIEEDCYGEFLQRKLIAYT